MTSKTPTSEKESTDRGCECVYFSNKDGTGWKVFFDKEMAKLAWATQIWAVRKDIAPLVLSGIKEINIEFERENRYFYCPVSGKLAEYSRGKGKYDILHEHNWHPIKCSDKIKNSYKIKYGFLTEEVPVIAHSFTDYTTGHKNYFSNILNIETGFDYHIGNWGILNNRIVFIDFGSHFSRYLSDKIKNEINKIKGEAV